MLLRQINHTPESLKNGIWAIEGAAHGLLTSGKQHGIILVLYPGLTSINNPQVPANQFSSIPILCHRSRRNQSS